MKVSIGRSAKNPFAVCKAMQKRHGWSKAKFKRCAEKVKARRK